MNDDACSAEMLMFSLRYESIQYVATRRVTALLQVLAAKIMQRSTDISGRPYDFLTIRGRRIIKGRPFEVGFECEAKLYRKEHPYGD